MVRITPHFYKPWSERPFGRGPTILLRGQQRSPWLLTTYPSPGMILQVMGDYLIELQVNLDDGNFAKRNSKMLGSFNFGPIFWEGIKLDAHVFWLLRKFLALFSIGKQWKKPNALRPHLQHHSLATARCGGVFVETGWGSDPDWCRDHYLDVPLEVRINGL